MCKQLFQKKVEDEEERPSGNNVTSVTERWRRLFSSLGLVLTPTTTLDGRIIVLGQFFIFLLISFFKMTKIARSARIGNSLTENKHLLLKAGNCILRNGIIIQLHVCKNHASVDRNRSCWNQNRYAKCCTVYKPLFCWLYWSWHAVFIIQCLDFQGCFYQGLILAN